jgi:hypothetical protein
VVEAGALAGAAGAGSVCGTVEAVLELGCDTVEVEPSSDGAVWSGGRSVNGSM